VDWIGLIWLRIGTSEGSCEDDIEPSSSIQCWEVLECNSFSELVTRDDGDIRPKHVMRRKGTIISFIVG
jgi:hypothetical protein